MTSVLPIHPPPAHISLRRRSICSHAIYIFKISFSYLFFFFFFNDTATTEIYTLSLHDALPIFGRSALISWPWCMLACSIFSTSRKDCDCDVTRASIGSSGDVSSLLFHGTQTAANGRAAQLQPLTGQRPESSLVLVPGPDDLVHHLHSDAK